MSASQKKLLEIEDISIPLEEKEKPTLDGDRPIINKPVEEKVENKIYDSCGKNFQYDSIVRKDNLSESNTRTGISGNVDFAKTMIVSTPMYKKPDVSPLAHIVCLIGPKKLVGKYWSVSNKKKMIIGRHSGCDIYIRDPSISKKHLLIYLDEKSNKVVVEDQNSTNGTIVNDKTIEARKSVELVDNGKIKMGNIVIKFLDKNNPEIFSVVESFNKVSYDALTGAGNRFMLETKADELFKKSKESHESLSLILFDIDHFKKINDTYGHLVGDFILKEVVRISKTCFRSTDTFTRCGGEEFCVIIKSEINRAKEAIEAARQKIGDHLFEHKGHKIKLTISAGVTHQINKDSRWKEMYDRADQLLYKAKATGRNKVFSSI